MAGTTTTPRRRPRVRRRPRRPSATTTVEWSFEESADEDEADQAASTMERRLVKLYELAGDDTEGIEVEVNDDEDGLAITLPTESEDEANETVSGVSFRGDLYFRPTLEGWPEEGAGDAAEENALGSDAALARYGAGTTTTGDEPTTSTTTTTTADDGGGDAPQPEPAPVPEATSPAPAITLPDDDDPEGTSVLPWRQYDKVDQLSDPESAEITSIWEVGPAALDGSAIEDTETTTIRGNNAVRVVLADDDDGLEAFNSLAESCFDEDATCPTGRTARRSTRSSSSRSVPRPDAASFQPFDQEDLVIWSLDWSEDVATTLAVAFEAGALPVGISPA
ncbi:MAG: hypothetical protein U5R31_05415 [Acidimicrobiia bacterium]|nr:hypothetical protein [Acidimicrobiia bacterium]